MGAELDPGEIASSPVGKTLLDELVTKGWTTATALAGVGEAELYSQVVEAAMSAAPDGIEAALAANAGARSLDPVPLEKIELARRLLNAKGALWWSSSWRDRAQIWLSAGVEAPEPIRSPEPAAAKPPVSLWTSSTLEGMISAWWPVVQSGYLGAPQRWSAWRVNPCPDARVFEIRSAEDWRWLCDAFRGREVESVAQPDWGAVREEFDGVHLTVGGLIRAQAVPITRAGRTTMLWGWDAEGTAWLRWRVQSSNFVGFVQDPSLRRRVARMPLHTRSRLKRLIESFRRPSE